MKQLPLLLFSCNCTGTLLPLAPLLMCKLRPDICGPPSSSMLKTSMERKFQHKFLRDALTKLLYWLEKWRIVDSDLCTFCGE